MPALKHATTPVLDRDAAIKKRETRLRQIEALLSGFPLDRATRDRLQAELIRVTGEIAHLQSSPSGHQVIVRHFLPDQTSDWLQNRVVRERTVA